MDTEDRHIETFETDWHGIALPFRGRQLSLGESLKVSIY